jgi:nucleoside-diphosphate-sugar epimerase
MSFLITGATGFIGQRVVRSAIAQGYKVAILTRSPEKTKGLFGDNIVIYDQNKFLAGEEKIDSKTYDKVIHLAWADVKNYTDDTNYTANLEFQKQFIDRVISCGIKNITFAGTCFEYGLREGICREDDPAPETYPTTYAKAKHELYKQLLNIQKNNSEFNFKWLRFFYVYGVGSRPNSLLSQLLRAIESGEKEFNMSVGDQKRDYINIETLAHNIVVIAGQNEQAGIINIGTGKPRTVLEFVEAILKIKNYNLKLNKGFYPYASYEPKEFWADVTKLKSIKGTKFDNKIWL